jgi:non-specific serine/threonine protein kinase
LTPEAVAASESVQLFLERARAARPDFTLTTETVNAVAEICAKLDGIPLALELAAARVRGMSVHDIASHLDDRFRLLSGGSRAALPRQQTLRALMDWSYNLLTDTERMVLRRSAVLVGIWSIDVAGGILFPNQEENSDRDLWQLLPRLVDKSLLMLQVSDHHTAYRMLDTIRHYARERLQEAGEEALLLDSHLHYFLGRAREAHPNFFTGEQIGAWHKLQELTENLRAALEWALVRGGAEEGRVQCGVELAIAQYPFWIMEGEFVEGIRWLRLAADRARAQFPALYAGALFGAGVLYVNFVDRPSAYPLLEESTSVYRELGDETNAARAELYLAFREFEQSHRAGAEAMWEKVLRVLQAQGDRWNIARTLGWQARAARYAGEYRRAQELYEKSADLFRRAGDGYMLAWSLNLLGTAAYLDGDLDTAEQGLQESAKFTRQHNLKKIMGAAYFRLGLVMWSRHDPALAEEYWKRSLRSLFELSALHDVGEDLASLALVAEHKEKWMDAARLWGAASIRGITSPYHDRVREPGAYEASMARVREALGERAFQEAWDEGKALPPAEAIHLALEI